MGNPGSENRAPEPKNEGDEPYSPSLPQTLSNARPDQTLRGVSGGGSKGFGEEEFLDPTATRLLVRSVLAVLVALSAFRLAGFAARFGHESLQLDFSAYYTAGEALNRGLSPYENNLERGVWDGLDRFRHSRFLYPPLVASLFRPMAALPYPSAKRLWMGLGLAALAVALQLATRFLSDRPRAEPLLAIALLTLTFHPLLVHLERGQMDTITLALTMAALTLPRSRKSQLGGGALLALAVLLKLHNLLLLPFLLLRRAWTMLAGVALGALALGAVSLAGDGPSCLQDYVTQQFPRIARYGEQGTAEMKIPDQLLRQVRLGLAKGETRKGASVFRETSLSFVQNSSLVRPLDELRARRGQSPSRISLATFAALFAAAIAVWSWRRVRPVDLEGTDALAFWGVAIACVLACAPYSWAMSVVWLLPLALLLVPGPRARGDVAPLALLALGLLAAGLPDYQAFPFLAFGTAGNRALNNKYVIAEALVYVSLVWLVARCGAGRQPAAAGTGPDLAETSSGQPEGDRAPVTR